MDAKTLEDLNRKFPTALIPSDEEGLTAITCVVRLQFVWLEKPRPTDRGTSFYQLAAILPDRADVAALEAIAKKAWVDSPHSKTRGKPKHRPLKEQSALNGQYDGFGPAGFYFDAKTKNVPELFGPGGKEDRIPVDRFYSGCWARVKVRAYAYDQNGNWGVGFGLQGVQLIADDVKFSKQADRSDGFEAVSAPAGNAPANMGSGASAAW